jgi:hypothetical protein
MHSILAHPGFCSLDDIDMHVIRVRQKSLAEAAQREQTAEGIRPGLQHQ